MWGNSQRTTTFVSATQLTATITAADLAGGAVVQVSVQDAALTTNSLPFTVIGQPPTITNSAPPTAPVNSASAITITVTGTNFNSNSKVLMNPDVGGTALTTNFDQYATNSSGSNHLYGAVWQHELGRRSEPSTRRWHNGHHPDCYIADVYGDCRCAC